MGSFSSLCNQGVILRNRQTRLDSYLMSHKDNIRFAHVGFLVGGFVVDWYFLFLLVIIFLKCKEYVEKGSTACLCKLINQKLLLILSFPFLPFLLLHVNQIQSKRINKAITKLRESKAESSSKLENEGARSCTSNSSDEDKDGNAKA